MKWLDKYMPQKWDDVEIHEQIKNEMDKWILDLRNKKTDSFFLYLCGPAGCGKTTMTRLLLEKYKYDILEWNVVDLKQSKTLEEVLNKAIYKQNIQILIQEKSVVSGILLEECDCLQNIGKEILTKITENIKTLEFPIPILCTSNELECDPIKNGKVIFVNQVDKSYILKLIEKIKKQEKWKLCKDVIDYLFTKMDNDMRNWLIQLEYIYYYFSSKKKQNEISLEMIIKYFETTQVKNNDYTLYQWTEKVFDTECTWNDVLHISDNDSLIFPMMIYSNVEYTCSNIDFLKMKHKIANDFIKQEIFREYSKKTSIDELSHYNTLISISSVYLEKKINPTKISKKSTIVFPSNIYNKKYTECTHRKHINQMMSDFDISKTMLSHWSYLLYWIYQNIEHKNINELVNYYQKKFPSNINNENLNEIFKCDYLREDIKKRKKENILKILYKLLDVDIKKNVEKKKRGRPKKT